MQDGEPTAEAFMPDVRTAKERSDSMAETSINWEDEPEALLSLRKHQQAANGIVRISRAHLEHVRNIRDSGHFDFERKEEDGNPFHGNLLFKLGNKAVVRNLAATLACGAKLVPAS